MYELIAHRQSEWSSVKERRLIFAGKAINQERNVMIPYETYASLTDEKIASAIRAIRAEDPGWYRIEQYGDGAQNLANVNRIWDIGQNIRNSGTRRMGLMKPSATA